MPGAGCSRTRFLFPPAPDREDKNMDEKEIKQRMTYYKIVGSMTELQLSILWMEITDRDYWRLLECVVPARQFFGLAFMVGEPMTDGVNGTVHRAVCLVEGRCFTRPATLELFNPAKYISEIKDMYFPADEVGIRYGRWPGRES